MVSVDVAETIEENFAALRDVLDERSRRLWAASEANALGHGGVAAVARATGLAESTIRAGRRELREGAKKGQAAQTGSRVRRPGGGRKPVTEHDPKLLKALDSLVEPTSRGDPQCPLRWTCKSTRTLAQELNRQGHTVSHTTAGELLDEMGYSLQGQRKTKEGEDHPDRDTQFRYIHKQVKDYQKRRQPVISVDTKKKELIGDFTNKVRE